MSSPDAGTSGSSKPPPSSSDTSASDTKSASPPKESGRDKEQVDSLLKKVQQNVAQNQGPYSNAAFEVAQKELSKAVSEEAQKAADEKAKLLKEAATELKKQNEAEMKLLEERHKNDQAAFKQALAKQQTDTQLAIQRAQDDAEKKYQQRITELIRQQEVILQEKNAKEIDKIVGEQKELRLQLEAQMKQMQEKHESRLKEQQLAAESKQEKTMNELKEFFNVTVNDLRNQHLQEVKDQELKAVADQEKLRNEFSLLLNTLETNHKEQVNQLQAKADLEAEDRRRMERDLTEKFNQQVLLLQKQASDAAKTQLDEFSKIQRDSESKTKEGMALAQAALAGPLAAVQGQLANATAPVGNAVGGVTDALGGLTGGLLGPVGGLLGGLTGALGKGGSPSILKLELCSVM